MVHPQVEREGEGGVRERAKRETESQERVIGGRERLAGNYVYYICI